MTTTAQGLLLEFFLGRSVAHICGSVPVALLLCLASFLGVFLGVLAAFEGFAAFLSDPATWNFSWRIWVFLAVVLGGSLSPLGDPATLLGSFDAAALYLCLATLFERSVAFLDCIFAWKLCPAGFPEAMRFLAALQIIMLTWQLSLASLLSGFAQRLLPEAHHLFLTAL